MRKLFLISTIWLLASCTALKYADDTEVVKGNYKVLEITNINNSKIMLVGKVYDQRTNKSINGAAVYIDKLDKGVFTDTSGDFSLEIPTEGTYEIGVECAGNTTIKTDSIKFVNNTKTDIVFYLGTVVEW